MKEHLPICGNKAAADDDANRISGLRKSLGDMGYIPQDKTADILQKHLTDLGKAMDHVTAALHHGVPIKTGD